MKIQLSDMYLVFSPDITNTTMKSKGVDVFFIQIIFKGTEAFSVKFTCCSGQRFPTAGTWERFQNFKIYKHFEWKSHFC